MSGPSTAREDPPRSPEWVQEDPRPRDLAERHRPPRARSAEQVLAHTGTVLGALPAIRRIHWGVVGPRRLGNEPGSLFALWPEPVGHDACFEEAGFGRFDDSDDAWDADFERLIEAVLATLGTHGDPVGPAPGERPVWTRSLVDRLLRRKPPELHLPEHLALAAGDDQFDPVLVTFGAPASAAIFVADGHPIVWVWIHEKEKGRWDEHLKSIAAGREIAQTTLTWDVLLPSAVPFSSGP